MAKKNKQCTKPALSNHQDLNGSLSGVVVAVWGIYLTSLLNDYVSDHPSPYLNSTLAMFGDCSVDHCYTVPTKTLLFCWASIVALYGLHWDHTVNAGMRRWTLFSTNLNHPVENTIVKDDVEQPHHQPVENTVVQDDVEQPLLKQ